MGRRHDPHVERDGLGRPQTLDGLLLKHAKQGCLELGGELGDLIEEDRAAVGLLEVADVSRLRAREGALLVAKEHRFLQGARDRGAVDRDERAALGAAAVVVDGARDELLAAPRRPVDQDADVVLDEAIELLEELLHHLGVRDDLAISRRRVPLHGLDLPAHRRVLELLLAVRDGALHRGQQLEPVDRLAQVIVGAEAHRAHHRLDANLLGQHDHRDLDAELLEALEDIEPAEPWHMHVEEEDVIDALVEHIEALSPIERVRRLEPFLREPVRDQPRLNAIIVSDKYATLFLMYTHPSTRVVFGGDMISGVSMVPNPEVSVDVQ